MSGAAAEPDTAIPYDLLMRIQGGTMSYVYKGRPTLKSPFDLALYVMLIGSLRPRTVVEIGSWAGGSAVWFADQLALHGLDGRVYSADVKPVTDVADPRVTFLQADARRLSEAFPAAVVAGWARPLLVIDDADHSYESSKAILAHFAPLMASGEYIVVEDGVLTAMRVAESYGGGPARAIAEFLAGPSGRDWEVDRALCDHYGPNVTWNPDGWLRRR